MRGEEAPGGAEAGGATAGEAFFTADRRVGPVLGGASLAATQVSAGTLIGTVGLHYLIGVAFLWIWVGIWAGWLVSLLLIAPQLRAHGGYTVPDFLADRYGDDRGIVRGASALLIAAVYLVYTTAQYVAGGVVLGALVGVGELTGAAVVAGLSLSYTAVGGMRASVLTDAAQVALVVVALAVAVALGVDSAGGLAALGADLSAIDPTLLSPVNEPTVVAGVALSFGLGIAVAPYELSRVYAMRDVDVVGDAIGVSIGIQAVIAGAIALLGLVARAGFPDLSTPDEALVRVALDAFGPAAGTLLLLGVFAAILSTVDSILLVTASALAHDCYEELFAGGDASGDATLRVARASLAVAAVVPIGLTAVSGALGGVVQFIVALYASLLAATLFVPVVAGLHWRRATRSGALAGMAVGFVAVAGWQVAGNSGVGIAATVDPVVPGVSASALATAAGSLITGSAD